MKDNHAYYLFEIAILGIVNNIYMFEFIYIKEGRSVIFSSGITGKARKDKS